MIKPTLPLGYKANGLACGIKQSGKFDLGLIFSEQPAVACGLFTTNSITSGSVKFSQGNLNKSGKFQAIIINSGNANCFTPTPIIKRARFKNKLGRRSAKPGSFNAACEVAGELARCLGIKRNEVLLASTGEIGKPLPVKRIKRVFPILVRGLSSRGLFSAARAITTTDSFEKLSAAGLNIAGKSVTICGLAKGAGMIAPDLALPKATMLCFILTDANIAPKALTKAVTTAVQSSFNCITVDGCMSTNDTLLIMSNSCADNQMIKQGSSDFNRFCAALSRVCLDLARMIIKDAEGASKFIQIKVGRAGSFKQARQVALSIANSDLFKTAVFGRSRNLGRIIAAIGASGVKVKEDNLSIKLSPLNKKNIYVTAMLNQGKSQATVYTSDLTPGYIKINADYS